MLAKFATLPFTVAAIAAACALAWLLIPSTQAAVVVCFLIGIAIFATYMKLRDREMYWIGKNLDMIGISKPLRQFKHSYTTPGGVTVTSTQPVPLEGLAAIQRGIQKQMDCYNRARPNWTNGRNLAEYDVLLVDPQVINQVNDPGSPAIYRNGIQTAGTVIGAGHARTALKRPHMVLPHQANQNWQFLDYLFASSRHESEHMREWFCLQQAPTGQFYYWATAGDVHPHVTEDSPIETGVGEL